MKNLSLHLLLGATSFAVVGSSAVLAQNSGSNAVVYGNPVDRIYSYSLEPSIVSAVTTGELTDDRVIDVLALLDGVPHLIGGPAYTAMEVPLTLPAGAKPATALTTKNVSSSRYEDAIVSCVAGLLRTVRDNLTGNYSYVAIPGTSAWANASQLLVADVHPAPGEEIVGLFHDAANGTAVMRVARLGPSGFVQKVTTSVPGDAISIHATNRYAFSSRLEMAVVSPMGAMHYAFQGGQMMWFDLNVWSDAAACAVSFDDFRGSGLAVAHSMPNGETSIGVYRESGVEPLMPLAVGKVTEMASASTVASDYMDLVVIANGVHVFKNKSNTRGPSFKGHSVYPSNDFDNVVAGGAVSGLAAADFDGDGDSDIYLQQEGWGGMLREAHCHMNRYIHPQAITPMLVISSAGNNAEQLAVAGAMNSVSVHLEAQLDNLSNVRGAGFSHLDIEVWSPGLGVDITRARLPVPFGNAHTLRVAMPWLAAEKTYGSFTVFMVRGVTIDANDRIDLAGPFMRFGVHMADVEDILTDNPIGIIPPEDDPDPPQGDPGANGGTPTGG